MGKRRERSAEERITWKGARAYLDVRDLGINSRVALKPKGESHATTDPVLAAKLARAKVKELEDERDRRHQLGLSKDADFRPFADLHIRRREESGKFSDLDLDNVALRLERAAHFFDVVQAERAETAAERRRCRGPRNLATISTPDVAEFLAWLESPDFVRYEIRRTAESGGRKGRPPKPLGEQSRRHHMSALSGLFKRAIALGKLPPDWNPVAKLIDPPTVPRSKTELLEADELALLLESARTCEPRGRDPVPFVYELLATHILTGARQEEVLQLQVRDVDFVLGTVRIRGTKTDTGWEDRLVPLHAQLREILRPYVLSLGVGPGSRLLFASPRTGEAITDWRKSLDRVARRAGFPAGAIRTRRFRTSYITHRLLSLDDGVPVTVEQVRQEVGHSSYDTVAETYARVSVRKERLSPFEFRVERYSDRLVDRLAALRAA